MERFRMYLKQKQNFLDEMRDVFERSRDYGGTNLQDLATIKANIELLEDIIHHFELFVKEKDEG